MNSRTAAARRVWLLSSPALLLLLSALGSGCSSPAGPAPQKAGETLADAHFALIKPSSSQPVTAAMASAPAAVRAGDSFEILVRVEIEGSHHIYAGKIAGKPFVPTTLDVKLPHGVEALGDWIGSEPIHRRNGELVYTEAALFRRRLKVGANVPTGPLSIMGELRYQACTEELCWPPGIIQLFSLIEVRSSSSL